MSHNRNACRAFSAFVLLVALLFVSLPASAQPARRAVSGPWKVAVLGEDAFAWVRSLVAGLWTRKEGMTIDPNGAKRPEGTSIDPNGALNDEGMTIDPNGRS
jgi:hypothetical protein